MRIVLIACLSILVSGCSIFNPAGSDEFSCPGMPKGVSCKTPREVYKITDTDKVKGKKGKKEQMPSYIFATSPNESQLTPVPVLEQAQVMRVWIAPWVDKNKDLHWPGLVFTQVQARQWRFGNEDMDGVEPQVPHRMYDSAVPAGPSGPSEPVADKSNGSVDMPKNADESLN